MAESAEERLLRARRVLASAEERAGLGPLSAGHAFDVPGGTSALLDAAVALTPAGGWVAFCGVKDVGWGAARGRGLDLGRLVTLPDPGPHAATVARLLVDAVDLVCFGPLALTGTQRRALVALARSRGHRVLTAEHWPGLTRTHNPVRQLRKAV